MAESTPKIVLSDELKNELRELVKKLATDMSNALKEALEGVEWHTDEPPVGALLYVIVGDACYPATYRGDGKWTTFDIDIAIPTPDRWALAQ